MPSNPTSGLCNREIRITDASIGHGGLVSAQVVYERAGAERGFGEAPLRAARRVRACLPGLCRPRLRVSAGLSGLNAS
jgi:hypothetical protein